MSAQSEVTPLGKPHSSNVAQGGLFVSASKELRAPDGASERCSSGMVYRTNDVFATVAASEVSCEGDLLKFDLFFGDRKELSCAQVSQVMVDVVALVNGRPRDGAQLLWGSNSSCHQSLKCA